MTANGHLGKILLAIADQLRGAMNADDFRDYMLTFLFLRYLSDDCETAANKEPFLYTEGQSRISLGVGRYRELPIARSVARPGRHGTSRAECRSYGAGWPGVGRDGEAVRGFVTRSFFRIRGPVRGAQPRGKRPV